MYGLMYSVLQSLVVNKVGNELKWKEICMKAGVKQVEFLNYHYYDEDILWKIITAACEVLDVQLEEVMENFGVHFFEKTKVSGHSHMLRTLGNNLFGFLINLDSLHSHLSFTYLEMQAPSFQCEKTNQGLHLHYYSIRNGLQNIVRGIVKAVAKDFFSLDIKMEIILEEKLEGVRLCYHYGFNIEVEDSCKDDTWFERLQGERGAFIPATLQLPSANRNSLSVLLDMEPSGPLLKPPMSGLGSALQCPFSMSEVQDEEVIAIEGEEVKDVDNNQLPLNVDRNQKTMSLGNFLPFPMMSHLGTTSASRCQSRRGSIIIPTEDWPINVNLFRACFPFHLIFDYNLVIKFMGVSFSRLISNNNPQTKLIDCFTIERPAIPAFTYQHIRSRAHNQFVLQTCKTAIPTQAHGKSLQFRGQMIPTSSSPCSMILFIASPRVQNIEELQEQGLYLSDIPVHDVTREMILLHHQLKAEMNSVTQLEMMRRRLEEEKDRVQKERERADLLLHAMLPESVAWKLKQGEGSQATFHSGVTILFSDIEGFTTICNKCHPIEVVRMLNKLYIRFDSHIDECNVYKVETIGDAYMVAAGLLDTSTDHAYAVTRYSFKMREEAQQIMRPTDNTPLRIRIGIHSGAVMAGVVGKRMPRYCLFGDTVNIASRMESHGEPGKIHISENTYNLMKGKEFKYVCRGEITVKGLEKKKLTYFVETLLPGEEPKTEFIPLNEEESTTDLSSDHSLTQRRTSSASFNIRGRSPSVLTNHSFSIIGDSTKFLSTPTSEYIQTHKVSVVSNTSSEQIVEETLQTTSTVVQPPPPSSTSITSSSSIPPSTSKRNQVSPICVELEKPHETSFVNGTTSNSSVHKTNHKTKHRSKKCVIC